jgi:hypothetical protein
MNMGPVFWLIATVGGAVLLGVALAYDLISTRTRGQGPRLKSLIMGKGKASSR